MFEPFSIKCVTCHASLRVRKPDALGQILACPKCGGMVMIERPAVEDEDDSTPEWSNAAATIAAVNLSSANYDAIDDILGDRPSSGDPDTDSLADPPQDSIDQVDQLPTDEQLAPNADWGSSRLHRQKAALMYSFAGLAGIGLAVAVGFMVRSGHFNTTARQPSPSALASSLAATNPVEEQPAEDLATVEPTTDTDVSTDETTEEVTAFKPVTPATDSPVDSIETPKEEILLASNTEPSPKLERESPLTDPTRVETTPAERLDEIAIDNFADVAPQLPPPAADPAFDIPSLPEQYLPYDSFEQHPPRDPIPPVDVAKQLSMELGFEVERTRLYDFLRFVSQLSRVPVTIDPDALRYSRMSPSVRVQVAEQDTIATMLKAGLQPIRLDYRVENGHVLIGRTNSASGELRLFKHDFTDLIDGGVPAEFVTDMIARLVTPDAWKGPAESLDRLEQMDVPGYLVVEGEKQGRPVWMVAMKQTDQAHFETVFLRDKLRISRGLRPRSRFERDELIDDWQRTTHLTQLVSPRTQPEMTFGRVVRELDRVSRRVRILVDWHALAAIGWEDASPLEKFNLREESLEELLRKLTQSRGMTYRCVGEGLIQITSTEAANQQYELAIHPIDDLLDDGMDPSDLIPKLKQALGVNFFAPGQGSGEILFDDGTQSLLVRLPQSGQNAIDWLLRSVRGSR